MRKSSRKLFGKYMTWKIKLPVKHSLLLKVLIWTFSSFLLRSDVHSDICGKLENDSVIHLIVPLVHQSECNLANQPSCSAQQPAVIGSVEMPLLDQHQLSTF